MQAVYCVEESSAGKRLDQFLAEAAHTSRAYIQKLFKENGVSSITDGKPAPLPASHRVRPGERFVLNEGPPPSLTENQLSPVPMELDIMFEDTEILVLNKPAGRVVHPGSGTREPTLVHGLLSYTKGVLSQSEDPLRPGIVHRLDKETSGVLVVAKSDAAHRNLAQQFADHSILRRYTAFCWGKPSPLSGEIRGALGRHPVHFQKQAVVSSGGKAAHTLYETHKIYPHLGISEVHCTLKTGRTHQVRVHLSSVLHCPLVGDPLYTRKRSLGKAENPLFREIVAFPRQALHAMVLGFTHPTTGQPLRFACPLPPDLARLKEVLESS